MVIMYFAQRQLRQQIGLRGQRGDVGRRDERRRDQRFRPVRLRAESRERFNPPQT